MSTTQLAPAETIAPQFTEAAEPMTQLDHMINYGRAMFGVMSDKLISFGEAVRHPSKKQAAFESAFALGGSALGGTVALAQEAPPATPAAASIRFYNALDISGVTAINKGSKGCIEGGSLNLNPRSNANNPTALHHSRYGKGWITKSPDGEIQTVHIRPKKGFERCFSEVVSLNLDYYIPSKKLFKKVKRGVDYQDPFKLDDSSGHAIGSISIMFKKVPHKK
jgi:hypothetical protein